MLENLKNMETEKFYEQHEGKVIETGGKFKHVMAITLDPSSEYKEGLLRCIVNRTGDVAVRGFIDRSELRKVKGDSLEHFEIGERIKIKNEEDVIKELNPEENDFIGLEDPDIFIDEKTGLTHVYFTMPFLEATLVGKNKKALVHLGHAVGKNLDELEMTEPALLADRKTYVGAKELSVAPVNKQGFRYNLIESHEEKGRWQSTVKVAIAEDMGKPWKYGETAFLPKERGIQWIGGHASPGPLLPKNFLDIGEGKMLGIINGREADKEVGGNIEYGIFSVGLFIYDYENGKIDWVSPEPLIRDSEARTITFASQFVPTENGKGILYAHVDDSFVRAYTLEAEKIKKLLS